mmetsp:Transcript_22212/g.21439  ORF Transcript_22212/g.21439 Transcript_22212/m.21439 type:complete len:152 (-) Transcript_22212:958-1413(-)
MVDLRVEAELVPFLALSIHQFLCLVLKELSLPLFKLLPLLYQVPFLHRLVVFTLTLCGSLILLFDVPQKLVFLIHVLNDLLFHVSLERRLLAFFLFFQFRRRLHILVHLGMSFGMDLLEFLLYLALLLVLPHFPYIQQSVLHLHLILLLIL